MQPTRLAELDATQTAYVDAVVSAAAARGLTVILDPHNYGYMNDNIGVSREIGVDPLMPSSMFADFWSRMAGHYKAMPDVYFGLMNEPNVQSAAQWKASAVAAVNAIRAAGATQKILVEGTAWTGAHSWISSGNATAWAGFTDMNFAYEVHQYLDSDSSGTHVQCASGVGTTSLVAFTQWAKAQGAQAVLGEIGWSTDPSCPAEGDAIMSYMQINPGVFIGFTYWAGGPWMGNYMYTIEPNGLGSASVVDQPQLTLILKY